MTTKTQAPQPAPLPADRAALVERIKTLAGEYADRNHGTIFGRLDSITWCQLTEALDQLAAQPEACPNLACPSVQARLAAQWGYAKAAPAPAEGDANLTELKMLRARVRAQRDELASYKRQDEWQAKRFGREYEVYRDEVRVAANYTLEEAQSFAAELYARGGIVEVFERSRRCISWGNKGGYAESIKQAEARAAQPQPKGTKMEHLSITLDTSGLAAELAQYQREAAQVAQAPAPVDGDVRELRKWLNEQPNQPVDRAALARVLHAVESAQSAGVPPRWVSDQIGGEFDDMTAGQGYRKGWNDCRDAIRQAPAVGAEAANAANERATFEVWAERRCLRLELSEVHPGEYASATTQEAWDAWQDRGEELEARITQLNIDWGKECADSDALLTRLGLEPEMCRTDGGWLNLPRIKSLLAAKGGASQNAGYVIARHIDGRVVMEGSNACDVRWGTDEKRARLYKTREEAEGSMRLLCDEEDVAYVTEADAWNERPEERCEQLVSALDAVAYLVGDCEEWAATRDPQVVVSMVKDYMAGVAASATRAQDEIVAPPEAKWRIRLTCCGRDDGVLYAHTWEDADRMRDQYTSGPGVHPNGYSAPEHASGHKRSAIVEMIGAVPQPPVQHPKEAPAPVVDPVNVPTNVLLAAQNVERYFANRGILAWKLGNLQSRWQPMPAAKPPKPQQRHMA